MMDDKQKVRGLEKIVADYVLRYGASRLAVEYFEEGFSILSNELEAPKYEPKVVPPNFSDIPKVLLPRKNQRKADDLG